MSSPLASVLRLQDLRLEQQETEEQLGAIPSELAALEELVAEASKVLDVAVQTEKGSSTRRRSLEVDLKSLEVNVSRHLEQLMAVKSNKEYRAIKAEMAHEEAKKGRLEEEILLEMETSDTLESNCTAGRATLADAEAKLAAGQTELAASKERLEQEQVRLAADIEVAAADLPADVTALVHRLADGRRGLVAASILKEACSLCRVRVRPQVLSQLRSTDRIIQCESCSRILYFAPEEQ